MKDPEPRTPAPGSLLLVQRFLNSTEMPDGVDQLRTAPLAAEWLERVTGVPVTVSEKQLARLVATREALRDLLEAHTGENVDPGVRVRLQKLLGHAPLRPVFTDDGATLAVDCAGVDSFLGMISTSIVEATLMGTWDRLKVCRRHSCRWAFYDHSKNGCSCWCSMRVCGTREKARAYRARRRPMAATPG
ncbi:MAG TPA: CGNR zinc finger domain-containing protein [Candidatus Acidoferrales bacterium]|nr:CGNR zinc finger domain-containing protein [Candidatus Acidoferrales bacterium]